MSDSSYKNINSRLKQHEIKANVKNNFHYIDVEKALNARVDEIFDNEDLYQEFSNLSPDKRTPDLNNLENLKFPPLLKAMIIAQVMVYGSEGDKKIVEGLYSRDVRSKSIAFADETLDKKARRENADKVNNATRVFEPGDELVYGEDSPGPKFRLLGR